MSSSPPPAFEPPTPRRLRDLDPRTATWDASALRARACPFCGASGEPRFERPDGLRVEHCSVCAGWFVSPAPDAAQLESFYRDYYARHRGEALLGTPYADKHRRNAGDAAEKAERVRRRDPLADLRVCELASMLALDGARVLDVGCGRGELAFALGRLGARVTGVDIDPAAVGFAREGLGLEGVHQGTLDDLAGEGPCDLVVLQDVLEPVLEPRRMLEQSLGFVRPGGFVYVWTPNGTRIGGEPEPLVLRVDFEHLQFLEARTVQHLAQALGLEIVHLESLGWLGSEEDRGPPREGNASPSSASKLRALLKRLPAMDRLSRARLAFLGRHPERSGNYHLFVVLRRVH